MKIKSFFKKIIKKSEDFLPLKSKSQNPKSELSLQSENQDLFLKNTTKEIFNDYTRNISKFFQICNFKNQEFEQDAVEKEIDKVKSFKTSLLDNFDIQAKLIRKEIKKILRKTKRLYSKELNEIFQTNSLNLICKKLCSNRRKMSRKFTKKRLICFLSTLCSIKYINCMRRDLQQNLLKAMGIFITKINSHFPTVFINSLQRSLQFSLVERPRQWLQNLWTIPSIQLFGDSLDTNFRRIFQSNYILSRDSSYFEIESEKESNHFEFNKTILNIDYGAVLLEYVNLQVSNLKLTRKMCEFLYQQIFAERNILLNCIFSSTRGQFYVKFQSIELPNCEALFLCQTQRGLLFGGYYLKPFDPVNPQNVIFSLTKQTVHHFKNNKEKNNLQTQSNSNRIQGKDKSNQIEKCLLRMGKNDLVIYQNTKGQLMAKSCLGEMYQNRTNDDAHLAGQRFFLVDYLYIFKVEY